MNEITRIDIWYTPGDSYATCYIDLDNENLRTYLGDDGNGAFHKGIVKWDPRESVVYVNDIPFRLDIPVSKKIGWVATWNKWNPQGNYMPYVSKPSGFYDGSYTQPQYDPELDPWLDE